MIVLSLKHWNQYAHPSGVLSQYAHPVGVLEKVTWPAINQSQHSLGNADFCQNDRRLPISMPIFTH